MLNKNIETFIACDCEYEDAKIVLYGAPFDSTTSFRPGARFGSSAMRHESFGIETYSPYQDKDLTDIAVFDSGDIELCFGSAESALSDIEDRVNQILTDDKMPIMLGGEHLVTLAPVRALVKKYPDMHIIHFDAHCDLRDDYLGAKLSHACVMRRCYELLGDNRIHQFGIRSGERAEFQFGKEHCDLHKFNTEGLAECVKSLAASKVPVYLSIDLDVLDPAYFPGTGTQEAGGIDYNCLLNAIMLICGNVNLVGADLVELAPMLDTSGRSTAIACKLLRELLLAIK